MKTYNSLSFSWKAVGLDEPESFVVVLAESGDSQKSVPQIGTTKRGTPVYVVGASEKQKSLWRFAWKSWGLKLSFVESIDQTPIESLLAKYQELSELYNSLYKEVEIDMNEWYAAKAAARESSYGGDDEYHRQYSGRD